MFRNLLAATCIILLFGGCKKNVAFTYLTGRLQGACNGLAIQQVDIALIEGLEQRGNNFFGNVIAVVKTNNLGNFEFAYEAKESGLPLSICIYRPNPFKEILNNIPYGQTIELYTVYESNTAKISVVSPEISNSNTTDTLYLNFLESKKQFAFPGPFTTNNSFLIESLPLIPYQIENTANGMRYSKTVSYQWQINQNAIQVGKIALRGCGSTNNIVLD